MSYVTEVTVILTDWRQRHLFEDLVEQHAGFRPEPAETWGPNCTSSHVYVLGLDYTSELAEAIQEGPWSAGSVVWVEHEAYSRPVVKVFGPVPMGGWSSEPEITS